MTKRFDKVNIEISNICNLQCSFCPEVIRSKKTMTLELFEKAIRQAAPLVNQAAFHLMGEPLVHGKLGAMLDLCQQHSLPVFLVTNGTLLTEEKAALLLHPALRQVNFSLHSFHDNFPGKDPTEYLDRIFRYAVRALQERPDLYLNFRLWNLKAPDASRSSNQDFLSRIESFFEVKIPDALDVRKQKSRKLKERLYLHFDTEFTWPDPALPFLGESGTCYGLRSHFGILADGTVVPCCLDKEGRIPLGSLEDSDLETILSSEKARTILNGFLNRKLVDPLCQRCPYVRRFS